MNEWDKYWSEKEEVSNALFDKVAIFYRKHIIPRTVKFFLEKNYRDDSVLLHAGCGSGRVDEKIKNKFRLLSLDISMPALRINNCARMLVQGDILRLPIEASSLDGIYNLGVMEHFTENEVVEMLKEFGRVLKPQGRITLFWPPEFSPIVIFLRTLYFIGNNVLGKNIKLSPDVITTIKSYRHAKSLCARADLKITDYYFGPKDFFTYVVITLRKNL